MHLLTAKQVEAAKPGTTLNDGGGLILRVSSNGTARWVYRFKLPGQRQREMGLGTFGSRAVTLALARQKAGMARQQVALGMDPITEAQRRADEARAAREAEARALTFGAYADLFVAEKVKQFSNPKHRYQWEYTFRSHVAPLRDKKLAEITRKDILDVLRPIWDTMHVTATRIRGRLESLFDHAIQNDAYPPAPPTIPTKRRHARPPSKKPASSAARPSVSTRLSRCRSSGTTDSTRSRLSREASRQALCAARILS